MSVRSPKKLKQVLFYCAVALVISTQWRLLPSVGVTGAAFGQTGSPLAPYRLGPEDENSGRDLPRLSSFDVTSRNLLIARKFPSPSKLISESEPIRYDLIKDFGATCNGSTDDAPAIRKAANAIRANSMVRSGRPVILNIPPGHECVMSSCPPGIEPGHPVFYAIPHLIINMAGSSVSSPGHGCQSWAGLGIQASAGMNARFNSVIAGSSCVVMVEPGQESRFPAGSWVEATGIDLMGWGYPPNAAVYEFLQIKSRGSGQICFTGPLKNSYSSSYPHYGHTAQDCGGSGCGGPATLYKLDPGWNVSFELRGGMWNYSKQLYFLGRSITLSDVTMGGAGSNCFAPSVSQSVIINNLQEPTCEMEVDKLIETLTFNGGSLGKVTIQSPSPVNLLLNQVKLGILNGTPQNTVCEHASIGTLAGGSVFGANTSFIGRDCEIHNIRPLGVQGNIVNGKGWSVNKGIFTNSLSFGPVHWAVPGAKIFFTGAFDYEGFSFLVTDLNQSGQFVNVYTTLSEGVPSLPTSAGRLIVLPDPYPRWSCFHCTGSVDAVDYSQDGAQNAPLYTYSNRIYTCQANMLAVQSQNPRVPVIDINSAPRVNVWGALLYLNVDVVVPDTSQTGSSLFHVTAQYDNFPTISNTAIVEKFGPVVNLKFAGIRSVTPTAVTGAKPRDNLK